MGFCQFSQLILADADTDICTYFPHLIAENIKSCSGIIILLPTLIMALWQMQTYNAFPNVHFHLAK